MKKILIIGSKGMAGHVLYYYLKKLQKYAISDISRSNDFFQSTYQIDVTEFDQLRKIIQRDKPSIVINCTGILNMDAELNPDKAVLINSYLPHLLARLGLEQGYKVIHLSTDCVFSGKRGSYQKNDLPDGEGFYARSKALGEVLYGNHLTLRTSIIGPELKTNGIGLFDWFMQQSGSLKGYTNALWTGISTITLAKCIHHAIENEISGLHHLVNGNSISKHDLICLFKKVFKRESVSIEPFENYVTNKTLLKGDSPFDINSYENIIDEMRIWLDEHAGMYPNYYFNK